MLSEPDDYVEEREGGKLVLFKRNGIFQARAYRGGRSYLYKSLRTRSVEEARKAATDWWHDLRVRAGLGLAVRTYTMTQVINEYVAMREKEHEQGALSKHTLARRQATSANMLRQIKRVVKFWHQYCGKLAIDKVDNGVLKDFIVWRKDYYHRMPAELRPKTARLNPTDKTLEWELTLGKQLINYAHERGYRGTKPLPTFTYQAEKKIVRPAFTRPEYKAIVRRMSAWVYETDNDAWRYTRLLLKDYVRTLALSGMRVGEANDLKWRDVEPFKDQRGNDNVMFNVRGKTGARWVVPDLMCRYVIELRRARTINKEPEDYVFTMYSGEKVITLIDQFQSVLDSIGILHNSAGERYTLYSLRHYYAVQQLKRGVPVFDLARNMGTSVAIIEQYYGKQATSAELATALGGDYITERHQLTVDEE